MVTTWIRCPVLGGQVTRVTDFKGNVTRIVCEEYEEPAGTCRLRKTVLQGGPLAHRRSGRRLRRVLQGRLDAQEFRHCLCRQ
jgi:hypothetical protein